MYVKERRLTVAVGGGRAPGTPCGRGRQSESSLNRVAPGEGVSPPRRTAKRTQGRPGGFAGHPIPAAFPKAVPTAVPLRGGSPGADADGGSLLWCAVLDELLSSGPAGANRGGTGTLRP